jgi:hypothetical protein
MPSWHFFDFAEWEAKLPLAHEITACVVVVPSASVRFSQPVECFNGLIGVDLAKDGAAALTGAAFALTTAC